MTPQEREQIERAIRCATTGGEWPDDTGDSLTASLDEGWAQAEDEGDTDLARRCEQAFNAMTGRTP
tara:strand:- start:23 stop:220 length:198 start_codon:yes stop_codon:yes gene_type:complete